MQVEWSAGDWWPATVADVFDCPNARTVYINYGCGWKMYNDWVGDAARVCAATGAINLELEDVQQDVEQRRATSSLMPSSSLSLNSFLVSASCKE